MSKKKKNWFKTILGTFTGLLTAGITVFIVLNLNMCSEDQNIINNEGDGDVSISKDFKERNTSDNTNELNDESDRGSNWQDERVIGFDKENRPAEFNISVLTPNHSWEYKSYKKTENGDLFAVLPPYLQSLPYFKSAIGFVAVGMSSQEGKRGDEVDRARRRADNIVSVIQPLVRNQFLYTLNMGQYTGSTDETEKQTFWQRRVIVIGILSTEDSMSDSDIGAALKDAMTKTKLFIIDHDDYSNFDFVKL